MHLKYQKKEKAIVLLEDGTLYEGYAAGFKGTASGEICFNTGMTGYQEVFTDPSYYGQIVVMTSVHIGNYGISEEESESAGIKISGLICKKFSELYSRPAASMSLNEFFIKNKVVVVSDVDTRALVRYIRSKGVMNAVISSEYTKVEVLKDILAKTPKMKGLELSSKVSTQNTYEIPCEHAAFKVSVIDYGIKQSILRHLSARGCHLKVFPYNASAEEVLSFQPDGIMLSNGPGDPAAMTAQTVVIQRLLSTDKPVFGICLGHQLLAQSIGISTYKMHHGHRGLNHPVKNMMTGHCEITSQNHGFSIKETDVQNHPDVLITHINLNDHTIEGIQLKNRPVFSVQYHPEAAPGPHDSYYLFDQFIHFMQQSKKS